MSETCCYCANLCDGRCAIHRDGYGSGRLVPICGPCIARPTPSMFRISTHTAKEGPFAKRSTS